tara:strand:- start:488 stop:2692 length:2205 start_codon:yes stop_codon:yes gene_type:complete
MVKKAATKGDVKKEFDKFANKISRLESLKHELNTLDTVGFESDVGKIRGKLKDINAIPDIESRLAELKTKVEHRDSKKVIKNKATRKLIERSKSVHEDRGVMTKKIADIESSLGEKRKVLVKGQLSKNEVKTVKEIPRMHRQLGALRRDLHEHTKMARVKVDSGVGVLVDSKFDDFVAAIKGDLSKKLREKELGVDKRLQEDLTSHKRDFERKYKTVVRNFNEKYKDRVSTELEKEVQERFAAELNAKLEEEKKKIIIALIQENARRLHAEKSKMIEDLEGKYRKKEKDMQAALDKEESEQRKVLADERGKLAEQRKKIHDKILEVEERDKRFSSERDILTKRMKNIDSKDKRMQEILNSRTGNYRSKLASMKMRVDKERERLENEIEKLQKQEGESARNVERKEKELERRRGELERGLDNEKKRVEQGLERRRGEVERVLARKKVEAGKSLSGERRRLGLFRRRLGSDRKRLSKERGRASEQLRRQKERLSKEHRNNVFVLEREKERLSKEHKSNVFALSREKERLGKTHENYVNKLKRQRAKLEREIGNLKRRDSKVDKKEKRVEGVESRLKEKELVLIGKEKEAREKVSNANSIVMKELEGKRNELDSAIRKLNAREESVVRRARIKLDTERVRLKGAADAHLAQAVDEMKRDMHINLVRKRAEMDKKLKAEDASRVEEKLKARETELRKKIHAEYKEKFRNALKLKEFELQQKKEELEQHVMSQAKKLFS